MSYAGCCYTNDQTNSSIYCFQPFTYCSSPLACPGATSWTSVCTIYGWTYAVMALAAVFVIIAIGVSVCVACRCRRADVTYIYASNDSEPLMDGGNKKSLYASTAHNVGGAPAGSQAGVDGAAAGVPQGMMTVPTVPLYPGAVPLNGGSLAGTQPVYGVPYLGSQYANAPFVVYAGQQGMPAANAANVNGSQSGMSDTASMTSYTGTTTTMANSRDLGGRSSVRSSSVSTISRITGASSSIMPTSGVPSTGSTRPVRSASSVAGRGEPQ